MITDTIKIIKCPRLNEQYLRGESREVASEVVVQFNEKKESEYALEPHSIMCDRYDPETGECSIRRDKDTYQECVFAKWKLFKKHEDEKEQ